MMQVIAWLFVSGREVGVHRLKQIKENKDIWERGYAPTYNVSFRIRSALVWSELVDRLSDWSESNILYPFDPPKYDILEV